MHLSGKPILLNRRRLHLTLRKPTLQPNKPPHSQHKHHQNCARNPKRHKRIHMYWMYRISATVGHLCCEIRGCRSGVDAVCARTACGVHGMGGVVGEPCHVKVHGGGDVVAKGVCGVSAIVQLWGWVSHGRMGDRCLEARQQSDEDKIDHRDLCV
jgi:hypothetical protein